MISVIMSTYRENVEYVHLSIRSILTQTYADFELIIVLDNPENQEILSVVQLYASEDPRIILVQNERNLGLARTLNKALALTKGEYVARMDADDISHPQRFELQLRFLEENNLDLVGTLKSCIDESGQFIAESNSTYYSPREVMRRLPVDDCIPHATWLTKKLVYDKVGGYRNMPRCEDYDFLLRAHKLGFQMGLCKEILFYHRINSMGITRSGLLEQALASWYLTGNYDRLEHVSVEEVEQNICQKITPSAIRRYNKAVTYFDEAVQLRRNHPLKCCISLIKCSLVSRYGAYRIFNSVKMKIVGLFLK